jgi:SAM-dependent methyltransferase
MKQMVREALHSMGIEVKRLPQKKPSDNAIFVRNGSLPWSAGYAEAKHHLITKTLTDSGSMENFRTGAQLPNGFGVGIDERCIEYPWLFSQLGAEANRILDAGSVFNHEYVLNAPQLQAKKIDIMTLAPEPRCYWQRGISYLYGDLRDMPFRNELYDAIACVSTLEHVGMDNRQYTHDGSQVVYDDTGFMKAMAEMSRVLKRGGAFFLTVPFGKDQNFFSFQQFNEPLLKKAIDAFGPIEDLRITYYRYSPNGWNLASAADCSDCEYVAWLAEVWDGKPWPNPIPREADLAAAARAIACVRIRK